MYMKLVSRIYQLLKLSILVVCFTACSNSRTLFNNVPKYLQIEIPEPIINNGDILDININSLNNQSTTIFSSNSLEKIGTIRSREARTLDGYIVDSSGMIDFPIIGQIKVSGETISSLSNILKEELAKYIKSPSVRIKILNFRVSILGEVNDPKTVDVLDQNISLPELISRAGGLKNTANRKNILIVRQSNNELKSKVVDITSSDIFFSEYYYLKQNDKVYIRPNKTSLAFDFGVVRNAGVLSLLTSILILVFK